MTVIDFSFLQSKCVKRRNSVEPTDWFEGVVINDCIFSGVRNSWFRPAGGHAK